MSPIDSSDVECDDSSTPEPVAKKRISEGYVRRKSRRERDDDSLTVGGMSRIT